MSRTGKIIVGIFVGLLLLCAGAGATAVMALGVVGGVIAQNVETEPDRVAAAAEAIASFDLPVTYREEYSFSMLGCTLVGYGPQSGRGHLMLAQIPASFGLDEAEIERHIHNAAKPYGHEYRDRYEPRKVGEQQVVIRGQNARLIVREGRNSDRQPYREVSALFEGKRGPAYVMVTGPISTWNQAEVDAFLASIR